MPFRTRQQTKAFRGLEKLMLSQTQVQTQLPDLKAKVYIQIIVSKRLWFRFQLHIRSPAPHTNIGKYCLRESEVGSLETEEDSTDSSLSSVF